MNSDSPAGTSGMLLMSVTIPAMSRISPTLNFSGGVIACAMSSSVIGWPARSEITGIGVVTSSITGWIGFVIFCTSSTIGVTYLEMNVPMSRPMLSNATRFRPSWMESPMSLKPTNTPASRSPMDHSSAKSASIFGNTVSAPGTRSLFSCRSSPRSTIASAAMPASKRMLPKSAMPTRSSSPFFSRRFTAIVAPSPVPPLSSASSCRKASRPVRPPPGSVTSTSRRSSSSSDRSR